MEEVPSMAEQSSRNFVINFSRGFFAPFRSVRLLQQNLKLLPYIIIPFIVNVTVFTGAVILGIDFFDSTVVALLPQGDAWYWTILYWVVWIIAIMVTAVLVFFSFTVVGNLIASPFNELLSERTEQVLSHVANDEPFAFKRFCSDALNTLLMEVKKMWLFVMAMIVILPLNLLPGVGNSIYTVLAVSLTLFFLSFEYLSFVMVRKRQFFKEQKNYIFRRKFLMLGFSCGVMAILAIPFFQLLCIPLAVVGITRLWCEEEGLVGIERGTVLKNRKLENG
jgi:CysZ protein